MSKPISNQSHLTSQSEPEARLKAKSPKPLAMLKIGGRAIENINTVLGEMYSSLGSEYQWILVHGGGNRVSEISLKYGIEPKFDQGIRQTSLREMDIIDMGLAGLVNCYILRSALSLGLAASGLSGIDASLFLAEGIAPLNHTGKIVSVNPKILYTLLAEGVLPVISPVSSNVNGVALNINADEVAYAIASAVLPEKLVFISDTDGIRGSQGEVLSELDSLKSKELIAEGVIQGGMIPKVEMSLKSIQEGIPELYISSINKSGDLADLFRRKRGTRISASGTSEEFHSATTI